MRPRLGYVLAVVLCMATLLVRRGLGFREGDPPMLVLDVMAVLMAAYVGGAGPGLFCTALAGLISSYLLLPPLHSLLIRNPRDLLNWGTMIVAGVLVSVLIEALHRARRRAEAEHERYRIVADNTYDWEFWLAPGGESIYQSPSCKRITGCDSAQFMADPDLLGSLVHPDDQAAFQAHRHGVVGGEKPGELLFRIVRPNGEIRWIEHYCQPVFDQEGAYLGARGSNSDVTERKRMQEAMVRTEKLMSVGSLAAGMAHEINNPLAGILQGVQVIKRRLDPAQEGNGSARASREVLEYLRERRIPEFLDTIQSSGERASEVVGNLLEFSSSTEADLKPTSINELVEKAVNLAWCDLSPGAKLSPEAIRITKNLDPKLPPARCIGTEIQQVVLNLLKNACQAVSDGGKRPEPPAILLATRSEPGRAVIEVADNGPGMEPDVLARAFEPFFTTRAAGQGIGLGLSVAYFIVTAHHHGGMSIDSKPGIGTRVTVELPL